MQEKVLEALTRQMEEMLRGIETHPELSRRIQSWRLRIAFEFDLGDRVERRMLTFDRGRCSLVIPEPSDLTGCTVFHTTPEVYQQLTAGDVNGRDAFLSGAFRIVQLGSMADLLRLRQLHNFGASLVSAGPSAQEERP